MVSVGWTPGVGLGFQVTAEDLRVGVTQSHSSGLPSCSVYGLGGDGRSHGVIKHHLHTERSQTSIPTKLFLLNTRHIFNHLPVKQVLNGPGTQHVQIFIPAVSPTPAVLTASPSHTRQCHLFLCSSHKPGSRAPGHTHSLSNLSACPVGPACRMGPGLSIAFCQDSNSSSPKWEGKKQAV